MALEIDKIELAASARCLAPDLRRPADIKGGLVIEFDGEIRPEKERRAQGAVEIGAVESGKIADLGADEGLRVDLICQAGGDVRLA